ncbi:MAG TPA: flagellar basal body-associated FliL family protein [Aliidongia sp.]|nr:flagellar basal body-associated FliL family protein [Aliidongia sp.]
MRRFRLLLILVGLLIVLAGLAGGLYFTGALDKLLGRGETPAAPVVEEPKKPQVTAKTGFFDLPEVLVMLDPKGAKKRTLLRMLISLQLPSQEDSGKVQALLPRLLDVCQVYLRGIGIEDITGADKQNVVRAELLKRLNVAMAPLEAQAVLFREVVVE